VVQNKSDTYRKTTSPEKVQPLSHPEKVDEDDIVKFEKALLAYWQMSGSIIISYHVIQHGLLESKRW
jgi:hypothetical protein